MEEQMAIDRGMGTGKRWEWGRQWVERGRQRWGEGARGGGISQIDVMECLSYRL